MSELVVLGNGFDLHHGLRTSYGHFAKFAGQEAPTTYQLLSQLFLASSEHMDLQRPSQNEEEAFLAQCWSQFEASLGLIDDLEFEERSRDNISEYMEELGMEEYIVDEFIDNISDVLDVFRRWVASIDLPTHLGQKFSFQEDSKFINFNYIESLEAIYGVDAARIFYIHGRRFTADRLIVGHDVHPPQARSKHDLPDVQYNPFYGYLRRTRKPVEDIVPKLQEWLCFHGKYDQVSVRGHSLGPVDYPYFETLVTALPDAMWSFSYHTTEDQEAIRNLVQALGLRDAQLSAIATLTEFGRTGWFQSPTL